MKKLLLGVVMFAVFTAGYITGSIRTRDAIALELGGLAGMGGTIESLKNLGKTVIEMQENINKLQTNINEVKKVREDIANYQGVYDKVMGVQKPKPQQQNIQPQIQKGIQQILTPTQ